LKEEALDRTAYKAYNVYSDEDCGKCEDNTSKLKVVMISHSMDCTKIFLGKKRWLNL
jgi:hypothetical protein